MNPYLDRQNTSIDEYPEGSILNESNVEDLSPIHNYKSRTGNNFYPK